MNVYKFNSKGTVYSKARPSYPDALFSYLLAKRVIDKNTVAADIGSGTGIFTIALSQFVNYVFAIEPNNDMRFKAEEAYKTITNITSINATAENTSLPDCSVDLITVAQAFHWFDRELFRNECKRILKPKGKVVLVWNDRDTNSEIIQDNFAVNKKFCKDFKGSSNGIDFSKDAFSDFFFLTSVTIPDSVNHMDGNPFAYCSHIKPGSLSCHTTYLPPLLQWFHSHHNMSPPDVSVFDGRMHPVFPRYPYMHL